MVHTYILVKPWNFYPTEIFLYTVCTCRNITFSKKRIGIQTFEPPSYSGHSYELGLGPRLGLEAGVREVNPGSYYSMKYHQYAPPRSP